MFLFFCFFFNLPMSLELSVLVWKKSLCLFSQSQANLMFHWADSSWQMSWKSQRTPVPSLCEYGYASVFSVRRQWIITVIINHLRFSAERTISLSTGFGIFLSRPLLYGLVSYFLNKSDGPGRVFLRGSSLPPAAGASNKVPGSVVKKP